MRKKNILSEFWNRIDIKSENECWFWLLSKDKDGYGYYSFQGKTLKSHRISYLLTCQGPIQPFIQICHLCDNPSCCNPFHLWAGTLQENTVDKINKNRQTKGEKIKVSSINEEEALEILRLKDKISGYKLAKLKNLNHQVIYNIWNGITWKFLDK